MKYYKEYDKEYIGFSDTATLIFVGCSDNGLEAKPILFGEDGCYRAYIVDENAETV